MTNKKKHTTQREVDNLLIPVPFWEVIYPLLFYYGCTVLILYMGRLVLGSSESMYMTCQCIVALATTILMYTNFYKPDQKIWGNMGAGGTVPVAQDKRPGRTNPLVQPCASGTDPLAHFKEQVSASGTDPLAHFKEQVSASGTAPLAHFLPPVIALILGTGINNLITMSPLIGMSAGFAEANKSFFASTLFIELLGSGILSPIMEELTYRGIIQARIRRHFGSKKAVLLSAFIFAFMHFNLVQFIYAFLLGIIFALIVEKTGDIRMAMTSHMALNTLAVLRMELGWLAFTSDKTPLAWGISLALTIIGLAAFTKWCQRGGSGGTIFL